MVAPTWCNGCSDVVQWLLRPYSDGVGWQCCTVAPTWCNGCSDHTPTEWVGNAVWLLRRGAMLYGCSDVVQCCMVAPAWCNYGATMGLWCKCRLK